MGFLQRDAYTNLGMVTCDVLGTYLVFVKTKTSNLSLNILSLIIYLGDSSVTSTFSPKHTIFPQLRSTHSVIADAARHLVIYVDTSAAIGQQRRHAEIPAPMDSNPSNPIQH